MIEIVPLFKKQLKFFEIGYASIPLHLPLSEFGFPLREVELMAIQKSNKIQLPQILLNFYSRTEEMGMYWIPNLNKLNGISFFDELKSYDWVIQFMQEREMSWDFFKDEIRGHIKIPPIKRLIRRSLDGTEGYFPVLNKLNIDASTIFPFDFHDSLLAYLQVEGGVMLDNVWLLDLDNETISNMEVSIEHYFMLAYKAKIFNNWQLAYLKREASDSYLLMKKILPIVFSNIELDLKEFGIDNAI